MIILRNKTYSLISDRTKAGIVNAIKTTGSIAGGVTAWSVLNAFGSGRSIKDSLLTSLTVSIIMSPITLMGGYLVGVNEFKKRNRTEGIGKKRVAETKEKISKINKQLEKQFPEINGICKVYKEIEKLYPRWNEGDGYPIFEIISNPNVGISNSNPKFRGVLVTGQDEWVGVNIEKGFWCLEDSPQKKINLKQYLLKYYNQELLDYKKIKGGNHPEWDDLTLDEIITYLSELIKSIQKNL